MRLLLLCAVAMAQPKVVDPGGPMKAPSDAVVLFDGKSAEAWTHTDGRAAEWTVEDGVLVCKSGSGDIQSREKFASAQIHLEFATPDMPTVKGQAKGNSGVFLQGRYEVQVLDSFENPTYRAGAAASVYGQHDPLVNVSRKPGEWQSYDFVFNAPVCTADGKVERPATLTLLHNGVVVQNHARITKPTPGDDGTSVCTPGPLRLQDHTHPEVKDTRLLFRNIWVRPL